MSYTKNIRYILIEWGLSVINAIWESPLFCYKGRSWFDSVTILKKRELRWDAISNKFVSFYVNHVFGAHRALTKELQ